MYTLTWAVNILEDFALGGGRLRSGECGLPLILVTPRLVREGLWEKFCPITGEREPLLAVMAKRQAGVEKKLSPRWCELGGGCTAR